MKKLSTLFLAVLFLGTVALPGCGSGGNNPPSQAEVNLALQQFVGGDLSDLVVFLDFFGVNNCAQLQGFIDDLVGENFCDDSGSFNVTVTNVVCDDGPPVTASFNITEVDDNCVESGDVTDGSVSAILSFDGDTVFMNITSSGITFNDLTFVFNVFQVTIDSALVTTCSGTGTVDGENCTVSADCNSCILQ